MYWGRITVKVRFGWINESWVERGILLSRKKYLNFHFGKTKNIVGPNEKAFINLRILLTFLHYKPFTNKIWETSAIFHIQQPTIATCLINFPMTLPKKPAKSWEKKRKLISITIISLKNPPDEKRQNFTLM